MILSAPVLPVFSAVLRSCSYRWPSRWLAGRWTGSAVLYGSRFERPLDLQCLLLATREESSLEYCLVSGRAKFSSDLEAWEEDSRP